jgi:hypothetical protein
LSILHSSSPHRPKPLPQAFHGFGVVHTNQHLVTIAFTHQRPVLLPSAKLIIEPLFQAVFFKTSMLAKFPACWNSQVFILIPTHTTQHPKRFLPLHTHQDTQQLL